MGENREKNENCRLPPAKMKPIFGSTAKRYWYSCLA